MIDINNESYRIIEHEESTQISVLYDIKYEQYERINAGEYLTHYTTVKNFYSIIKTDGFWATHARFSNDDEELKQARKVFNNDELVVTDTYVVSLCGNDDLLSQWRGYARDQEGIAISLDLSTTRYMYLAKKGKYSEPFPILPHPILYIDDQDNELIQVLNIEGIGNDKIMPYIKQKFFEEEKEYRLAIINDGRYDPFITYRESGQTQVPYVEIRPGNPKYNKKRCIIRANVSDEIKKDIQKQLETSSLTYYKNFIVSCRDNNNMQDDRNCFGCEMRAIIKPPDDYKECAHNLSFKINNNKNAIIISQGKYQRETFEHIARIADAINKNQEEKDKIKVWCEGHLPIRSIRVGNTRRIDELKELILQYCKYSEYYWLRYVDVDSTKGSFRSAMKF